MSAMKRPDACMACDRKMRNSHTKKADAPDTVVYAGHGLCATCGPTEATSEAGEEMELCRWVPAGEVFAAELVSGVLVSQTTTFYRLMIGRQVRKFNRPEWVEVIA